MVRVLIMAESSLLADAIVSNLAQEGNLDVFQIAPHQSGKVAKGISGEALVIIVIEDGNSSQADWTADDWLQDYGCFRLITISSSRRDLRVCDRYRIPVAGIAQMVDLVKNYRSDGTGKVDW